ncbi:MAG: transporter permease, partial [Nocardioides sp.]|nr:transporter permease [Nocardioides sp.]
MNRWLTGWRLSLRLARRDALRARGRSILVLVMIALPVLAVTAADVVLQTQDVSSVESLDRRLGSASAAVTVEKGIDRVVQAPDPDQGSSSDGSRSAAPPTAEEISGLLGGARLVEMRTGETSVVTTKGEAYTEGTELDLRDPVAEGLFRLTSGRLPDAAGEVVVNRALADKGYAVGDHLDLADENADDPTIVGIAESTTIRDSPVAAGPIGSLHVTTYGATSWLVAGGPVPWSTVLELNAHGASVLSRAVIMDPPSVPPEVAQYMGRASGDVIAVIVLIVVMALIEVVLLAGPAFAVGARRQARSLALMASAGGTPPQTRRVVLAGAVVLGGTASLLGVVAGIGAGRALVPVLQRQDGAWFGPFDVPWLHLVGVAGFGVLSAFLAAVVPATIASRQDVVAVLAGRRGDRKPSFRSPVVGLVLLGLGVAGAAIGSRSSSGTDGSYFIAGSAIASVLGMLLLVPVVLVAVSALASRLPLTLRYAARDAARHRTRTVPAVAAVAATVAGVVALGIALSSDEAQNEAEYTPSLARGVGVVTGAGDYATYTRLVRREVPAASVAPVAGVVSPSDGFRE